MNRILTLDKPIQINGKTVKELEYNPLKITALQFAEASTRAASVATARAKTLTLSLKQSDSTLHLYLGMMAVIAVNPEIDITDLERIEGYDALELADIGMLFTFRRWEEPSEKNSSEKQSENTADTSTQASEKSDK